MLEVFGLENTVDVQLGEKIEKVVIKSNTQSLKIDRITGPKLKTILIEAPLG